MYHLNGKFLIKFCLHSKSFNAIINGSKKGKIFEIGKLITENLLCLLSAVSLLTGIIHQIDAFTMRFAGKTARFPGRFFYYLSVPLVKNVSSMDEMV